MGPFHTTVFAFTISCAKSSRVSGPMSSPCQSSGISLVFTTSVLASLLKSSAISVSTGSRSFTFFSFAFSSRLFASSILSSSSRDLPILPPIAFVKVYAMPPPMSSTSTLLSRFSITPILSDTFAPPSIATKGRSGFSTASPKNLSSFSIRKPETLVSIKWVTPSVEACARCAVPKASFTYISPNEASAFAKLSSFASSSLWKRRFSSSITSPSFSSAASFLASSPITSLDILTGLFKSSESLTATGASEYLGFTSPFGRPKWLISISFAPAPSRYCIVGSAPSIRLSSVILRFSSMGTLKSARMITLFPFGLISLTVFFILYFLQSI